MGIPPTVYNSIKKHSFPLPGIYNEALLWVAKKHWSFHVKCLHLLIATQLFTVMNSLMGVQQSDFGCHKRIIFTIAFLKHEALKWLNIAYFPVMFSTGLGSFLLLYMLLWSFLFYFFKPQAPKCLFVKPAGCQKRLQIFKISFISCKNCGPIENKH